MLLECISGSRAYGLDTPSSDTDIRGLFYMPYEDFYGLNHTTQVANSTNDIVYYELGRYVELLLKNNPNILELLNTPDDCVLYRHPIVAEIRTEDFLSKLCMQSFAGYAQTQIKKAGGLNKKIFNPVDKERKTILDFCYVIVNERSTPLIKWLASKQYEQHMCGLSRIVHAKDMYAVYHSDSGLYKGIMQKEVANDVSLSSIPEGMQPVAIMSFNKDGYSAYCKDYKKYWDWVDKRNDVRFANTIAHGKNYDAKNMMHTFRLLNMAEEIAREKRINVRRKDRDFLFSIKSGVFLYEDLLKMADEKLEQITLLFEKSDLPDMPDENKGIEALIRMRTTLYKL